MENNMGRPASKIVCCGNALAWRRILSSLDRYQSILTLIVPMLVYAALVSWNAYKMRDQINPDAVCYIRNALYIAEGRFADSVSGYWSPLISWCMAPLLYFGMDGLHAARIVLAIWGGVFMAASHALVRCFTKCNAWMQMAAMLLIAIPTVRAAIYVITPDLMLFALLMLYSAVTVSPKLFERKRLQVLAGLLAGLAYLAKSYALPFFLAHYTFVIALHWWNRREQTTIRRAVLPWAAGLLGFAIVSGPWIGVLSCKYEKPTFSTAARNNRSMVGPRKNPDSRQFGMCDIEPGRIYICETHQVSYKDADWSPFESWAYAKLQIMLAVSHSGKMIAAIRNFDMLGISFLALIFLPLVLCGPGTRRPWFKSVWMLATVLIYCSGFTMVYYESRYIEGFLRPLCCIYCLGVLVSVFVDYATKVRVPRWSVLLVALLVIASFARNVQVRDVAYLNACTSEDGTLVRKLAHELRAAGLRGPFATDELHRTFGAYLALHMNEPYHGSPIEADIWENQSCSPAAMSVLEIEAALQDHGVQSFLIHSDWPLRREFHERTWWKIKAEVPCGSGALYLYECPAKTIPDSTAS